MEDLQVQAPYVILGCFGLGALLLMIALGWKVRLPALRNPTWEKVARRLGGKLLVKEGNLRIRFRWNGVEAALFQGDPVRFSIADAGLSGLSINLSERRGVLSKGTGDKIVRGFRLATPDFRRAEEFFSPLVQKVLVDLESLGHVTRIRIEESFEVTAAPGAGTEPLVRFVSLCLQLAQHARVFAGREGVMKVVAESATDPGLCQICGAGLEGVLVSCAKCATRHHHDCWEYTGICSTYGCGERRAVGA